MPVFKDSAPTAAVVPEGDYFIKVRKFEMGVSTGQKTKGFDMYEVVYDIEPAGQTTDRLIDSPTTNWKLDLFLKAAGVRLAKEEPYEFREDIAKQKKVRWINPIGFRLKAHITIETYPRKDGSKGQKNEVGAFILPVGESSPAPEAKNGAPEDYTQDDNEPF